jgi:hypothetical protein
MQRVTDLTVAEISSVDKAANKYCRVLLRKRFTQEKSTMTTMNDVRKAAFDDKISRAAIGGALDVVVKETGLSLNQLIDKRHPVACELVNLNQELGRLTGFTQPDHVAKNVDIGGAGGLPPGDKADDEDEDHAGAMEALVDAHQKANPKMSRSKSYTAIMRTARGAAVAGRAIQGGQAGYRDRRQLTHGVGVGSLLKPDMSRL